MSESPAETMIALLLALALTPSRVIFSAST